MSTFRTKFDALKRASGTAPVKASAKLSAQAIPGETEGAGAPGASASFLGSPVGTLGTLGTAAPAADVRSRSLATLRAQIARVAGARAERKKPTRLTDQQLAEQLGADVYSPGLLCKHTQFGANERHGNDAIRHEHSHSALHRLAAPHADAVRSALFFDTETTGLAGGTGTIAFLLGTARFENGDLHLYQWLLTAYSGESAMLTAAAEQFADADSVVSFNGKSFDAPLLATRARLAGQGDPTANRVHIDLLHPLRRAYARQWPDCRLGSAETRLFELCRTDDLPGHEVPQVWSDWLFRNDPSRLGAVLEHNWLDLVSLAALAPRLAACLDDPFACDADALALLKGDLTRDEDDVASYLSAHRHHLNGAERAELARLARRTANWPLAVELWTELAAQRDVCAIENLAKYFEHQAHDFESAQKMTQRLRALQPCEDDHVQREVRLSAKIARQLSRAADSQRAAGSRPQPEKLAPQPSPKHSKGGNAQSAA
jgi:uncharacterized protein YprB with RNaseH-like and TPR domain